MDFRYESATCKLTKHDRGADLTHVYSKTRGQGHATGLLKLVTEYADANGLDLYLRVQGYGGPVQTMLSNEQLIEFYSKFGFVVVPKTDKFDHTPTRMSRTKNTPYSEREN